MPLTDREWYLVRQTYEATLLALIDTCEKTGLPGRVIIDQLIDDAAASKHTAWLRIGTEAHLKEYKPDADPR
jgi:hypothetical protein